jgi:RanBP-type and C3HC4-type zinc finger-containing protein 1
MTTKTIEFAFPEFRNTEVLNDNPGRSNNNDNAAKPPTIKTLNFDGLTIELVSAKKPAAANEAPKPKPPPVVISFDTFSTEKPAKPAEVVLKQVENQPTPGGLPSTSSHKNPPAVSPKPKQIIELNMNQLAGSLDTMKFSKKKASQGKKLPANEPQAEPPPFTEEDWKVFKQFVEVPEPEPCYDKLVEMGKMQSLVANQDEFVCSICESFVIASEGVVLKNCLHNFCRLCLIDTIKTRHNDMGEVKCPFPYTNCEFLLDDEEVQTLLGDDFKPFIENVMEQLNQKLQPEDPMVKLLANENLDVIENFEAFECQICYVEIEIGDGVIIRNCLHKFCKECLVESVKHSEEFEVGCPEPDCKFKLQEREVRKLAPPELFDKHLEKSLKLYQSASETAVHCKTPDCPGWIEADKNVRGFTCPSCDKVNCIGCKAIHQGKNCQEYQDEVNPDGKHKRENEESEKAIKDMILNNQAMYCPRCGIPVEKVDGCDYITCGTCRLAICWVTKKPRQPLTKQDGSVIDGCHCMENGRRCHVNCGNCH